MPKPHRSWYLLALALGLPGCAPKEVPITEANGECGDVFSAQVCTWVRTKGTSVVEAGATVPLASIEKAPAEPEMGWPPKPVARLRMPATSEAQTGITELTTYWEAMGHPPGPYLTPHFDFHFYVTTPEAQAAIDCTDLSKPAALPAGYALPDIDLPPPMAAMIGKPTLVGVCVEQMGMHSLPARELADTVLFRGTMVIGFYQGKPIFIEPMLTRAMLLEKKAFDLPIPTIPGMTGPYPRTFHADFDAEKQVYHFVFSGFAPAT